MSFSLLNTAVNITVDIASWVGNSCPAEVVALGSSNPRMTSVENALLFTALCTRPPSCSGFSLADMWAWIRYRPAIADAPWLKLRPEWNEIDPHQKTVLSDELGVGFTTELLAMKLGFQLYSDTSYVVRVVAPGAFDLMRSAKTGPSKSPDYIVLDADNQLSVLECKGSQSSHQLLLKAIGKECEQKTNIRKVSGQPFKHKLVAGLFIPQTSSEEQARIHVKDPEPEALVAALANVRLDDLRLAVVQIALAKHLSLMGLHSWANVLAVTPTASLEQANFPEGLDPLIESNDEELYLSLVHYPPELSGNRQGRRGIRFHMSLPRKIYDLLRESPDLRVAVERVNEFRQSQKWEHEFREQDPFTSRLVSPFGFTLSLEYVL